MLDISLPLCRGRLLSSENGMKFWVRFKYERLSNICYWCGRSDHPDKECKLWMDSKGILTPNQKKFDQSLRASLYRSHNKPMVFIPRYYDGVGPSVKRYSEDAEGSHQGIVQKSDLNSLFKMKPDMEKDFGKMLINAELNSNP